MANFIRNQYSCTEVMQDFQSWNSHSVTCLLWDITWLLVPPLNLQKTAMTVFCYQGDQSCITYKSHRLPCFQINSLQYCWCLWWQSQWSYPQNKLSCHFWYQTSFLCISCSLILSISSAGRPKKSWGVKKIEKLWTAVIRKQQRNLVTKI